MNHADKSGSFVPVKLLSWIGEGIEERRFAAAVAFADVSGFTVMSEQLARIGREGAETLTGILNSYFSAMIEKISVCGGFVGKFGGDAMTIFFPQEDGEALEMTARRATAASCALQIAMEPFRKNKTRAGEFSLGMKIGVSAGEVLYRLVSDETGAHDYLLAGSALDAAAEAEHHGVSGEVVLGPSVSALYLPSGGEMHDGFYILRDPSVIPPCAGFILEPVPTPAELELARKFINPAVFHRMQLGLDSVGEIRKVSVVFLAFSGLDYDGDPKVGDKLLELYRWVQGLVKSYGGSINKVDMGDKGSKILITFGAPTAHENDEQLALRCGLQLVAGHESLSDWGVRSRAGIATGTVFAGEVGSSTRQEYTVMGRAVNLAARLMGRAASGDLLIEGNTYSRCESLFDFGEPESVPLKGIAEPVAIYKALGVKSSKTAARGSGENPLVGRLEEREAFFTLLSAVHNHEPRTLVLKGDAGLGKSRLANAYVEELSLRGFQIGAGEALSYAKTSPYLSVISALRGLMDLPSVAGDAASKLKEIVESVDPEHPYRLPIVGAFLGVPIPDNDVSRHFDASLRQENLFDFVVIYLKSLLREQPVAIVVEDAQWIDKNSLEFLAYLHRNLTGVAFLLLLVRRQYSRTFISPHIAEIESAPNAKVIALREFSRQEADEFIAAELECVQVDAALSEFVYTKSQGNAAFIEELLKNLKTSNLIQRFEGESGVTAAPTGDLTHVEVPDSLNSLIMSQLDRMSEEAKLTVKVAAVIGRRFAQELLLSSYPVQTSEETLVRNLRELSTAEFVLQEGDAEILTYIFKNLLTRDVAYDSLLFAHRREYHRRVGVNLEAMHSESLKEWSEELARHFNQTDDDQRAVKYLGMAGDKSFDLYANDSAEDYYNKALSRAAADDAVSRFRLLTMRAKVHTIMGKSDLWKSDLDDALSIAELSGDERGKVNTLDSLAQYFFRINNLDELERVVNEAYEILARIDHPFGKITILSKMGALCFARNDYRSALQHWQESSESAEKLGDKTGLSIALTNCGLAHKALGNLDAALELYLRSIEIDRQNANLKSEAVNLGNLGVLYHQRGDFAAALDAYLQALDIGRKIGSKEIQARNLGNVAILYQLKGERTKALSSQQEKLSIEEMMGYRRGQAATLSNIGMWYAEEGDLDRAISYYDEALTINRDLKLKGEEPRLIINLGLAHHHRGDLATARRMLSEAVQLSSAIGQKVYEQFARRYLGFALLDSSDYAGADREFNVSLDMATAMGSKVGVAASKAGMGLTALYLRQSMEGLEESIAEVRTLGDVETLIKAQVTFAKWLLSVRQDRSTAQQRLSDALELARSSGRRRDVLAIEPLLESLASGTGL